MTAAELEAKIQNLARWSNWRRQIEWREFIQTLAARDIPRALAAVENISERNAREVFRSDLLEHWAQSDPSAALAYAQSVPGDFSCDTAVLRVLNVWANYNPSSLRARVQEFPNGRLRRQALDAVVGPSAAEDPLATLDLIQSTGDLAWRSAQLETMFEMWARTDPAAAIAKAAELPSADVRAKALAKIAGSWAAADPKAALAWAETLPAESQRDKLLGIMLLRWDDSKQAAAYLLNLPGGRLRDKVFPSVVGNWARHNPSDVLAWGQSLTDASARAQATEWVLTRLAESRPQEALALAMSQSLSGQARDDGIRRVGRYWAGSDPEGALEHARLLAEGADRNTYMAGLVEVMADSSPSTAAQLVTTLPPNDARDQVVRKIVNTLSLKVIRRPRPPG